jgi:DNA-binding transcriptional ArsR family regulator
VDSPIDRRARYELAHFGEAIGDPSRAAMLVSLMGGEGRPASDLARVAGIAPSTATSHLQRLEAAGLVLAQPRGRHRYYTLAGAHVAHALESIAVGSRARGATAALDGSERGAFALARTCYGHLAGRLAVAIWAQARALRWVRWSDSAVTLRPRGVEALHRVGLLGDLSNGLEGRPCIDWSERVAHVSGPLGIALCDALCGKRWLTRTAGRLLRITPRGREGLRALDVRLIAGPVGSHTPSRAEG